MPVLADRVQESTTTGGTGTLTLAGAVTGYRSFAQAFSIGDITYYTIDDGAGNWEIGVGTVGSGTLSRDSVLESSNANALVNFSAGTKRVFCSAPTKVLIPDQASNSGKVLTTNGTDPAWTTTLNDITLGNITPGSGAFTTLSASSTVSGTGFSTYLASPPAIGGTTPAAGAFTTLSSTGNTTLGDASADTLTINGTAVSAPNGLNVNSNQLVLSGGNLGIGQPDPSAWLSSGLGIGSGSGNWSTTLWSGTGSQGNLAFADANSGTGRYAGLIRYDHASDFMSLWTASTERLRIDSSGNVGIGTSSPGAGTKLNVAGRGLFTGGAADPNDSTASGVAINYDGTTGFVGAIQTGVAVRPLLVYGSSIVLAASPTGTPTATFDSSGNLGLGVTPSGWGGGFNGIQFKGGSITSSASTNIAILQNAYYNGSAWTYVSSSAASKLDTNGGAYYWFTAPSGTAGNPIVFNTAMTLDASGNLVVGDTTATARLTVKTSTNDGSTLAIKAINSTGAELMRVLSNGYFVTGTASASPYNNTTASAANLYVDSGGLLYRSTSSSRYKNSISDATHGIAEVLKLRSVTYKGNGDGDTVFGGLIAEEVHDAGLNEFVQYNDDGQPDSLAYGNMVSLAFKAIQELHAEIELLKAKVN